MALCTWGLYVIGLDGHVKFLTTVQNASPQAEIGGKVDPSTDTVIVGQSYQPDNPSPDNGAHQVKVSVVTGAQTPVPFPLAPAGTFWDGSFQVGSNGPLIAWLTALPASCYARPDTCPDAPVNQYKLDGSTWKPTGVLGKSTNESADGRIVAQLSTSTPGSATLLVDGRTVATGISDVAWTSA
jgi:hypothetical protein